MSTAAVIVAAGRGSRMGGDVPKQYQMLGGQSVLARSIAAFAEHPDISSVAVVLHPDDLPLFKEHVQQADDLLIAQGGATRSASVKSGLACLPAGTNRVLIHDAARPLVPRALIDRVIAAIGTSGAAPALAIQDAIWRGDEDKVIAPQPRDGLYRAQTPQGFDLQKLRAAYAAGPVSAADDVEVALAHGLPVTIVDGDECNLKLTRPGDFELAQQWLEDKMDIRVGNGFDVHRFGPGDHVTLCGVEIAFDRGLQGHSDADVGMHAVTDAIYGALAEGDIGQHFPPSDPQWKGAASHIFLAHAMAMAQAKGYRVNHADCTLICEQPKIGPHAPAMRREMAGIMGLKEDQMSVKATTSERLGFTGRQEGIAAMATATLVRL